MFDEYALFLIYTLVNTYIWKKPILHNSLSAGTVRGITTIWYSHSNDALCTVQQPQCRTIDRVLWFDRRNGSMVGWESATQRLSYELYRSVAQQHLSSLKVVSLLYRPVERLDATLASTSSLVCTGNGIKSLLD